MDVLLVLSKLELEHSSDTIWRESYGLLVGIETDTCDTSACQGVFEAGGSAPVAGSNG
jgi:hypothetical protein